MNSNEINESHYPYSSVCKTLKEIGFPDTEKMYMGGEIVPFVMDAVLSTQKQEAKFVCPSIAELLDQLPGDIMINGAYYSLVIEHKNYVSYKDYGNNPLQIPTSKHNAVFRGHLPNALGDAVIWLYENKLISFTDK